MTHAFRIDRHPILPPEPRDTATFTFDGRVITGVVGEPVTSALFAAGIRTFGRHPADRSPQGIFCANGQCSQCLVLADGIPVKGCMHPVREGLEVRSLQGLPALPPDDGVLNASADVEESACDVLVVGGGPAGITGAIECARAGLSVLLVDDKHRLGGKLVLQTHSFFGSVADCWAGTRGIDIGTLLEGEIGQEKGAEVWLNSTVVGCFADGKFGVVSPDRYRLVKPRGVLVATGAREKSIVFPGWDLPGVYGAGAFQTLVNRDRVRSSRRIFILGGGNVGLIAAYHAMQAGIDVVGLVEALPRVGGYKVHQDKILRLGVPVHTRHTVLRAEGNGQLERVVIAGIDDTFNPLPGTERAFAADTLLVAVGLNPVDELYREAVDFGFTVRAAGDAQEIAEASAAMFSGRIEGRKLAREMGVDVDVPDDWEHKIGLLKSRPGELHAVDDNAKDGGVYPVIRCVQEIPCNPCVDACPKHAIRIEGDMTGVPHWTGECTGCGRCVAVCPGLAITLVDERKGEPGKTAHVTVSFEMLPDPVQEGATLVTVDADGEPVGKGEVVKLRSAKFQDRALLVTLRVPWDDRRRVAGIRMAEPETGDPTAGAGEDDPIVCRCERVTRSQILAEISRGVRDMNQLKARLRCAMGACGGKTCTSLIQGLFRGQGIDLGNVTEPTRRPFVSEIPMGLFAQCPPEGVCEAPGTKDRPLEGRKDFSEVI